MDPCLAFAEPVMQHMNDDHSDSLKQRRAASVVFLDGRAHTRREGTSSTGVERGEIARTSDHTQHT